MRRYAVVSRPAATARTIGNYQTPAGSLSDCARRASTNGRLYESFRRMWSIAGQCTTLFLNLPFSRRQRRKWCLVGTVTFNLQGVLSEESALAAELPRTHFLNVQDEFCAADASSRQCGPFIPGTTIPSHMDTNHLNAEASFSLWPRFRAFFLERHLA